MKKSEISQIRWKEIALAKIFFGSGCFCCGKSIFQEKKRKTKISFVGFAFHHLEYREGEPRRKDYHGKDATWHYKKDVLHFVWKYPDRFLLLCKGCHFLLERCKRKTTKSADFLEKLKIAVEKTHTI